MKNEKIMGHLAAVVCVLIWGTTFISTKILLRGFGSVETSIYIYLTPIVTLAASALILQEPVTGLMMAGTILTLAGLLISEIKPKENGNANEEETSEKNTGNENHCPDEEV